MADESIEREAGAGRVGSWWSETKSELRRVVWPSRDEATNLTWAVLFVTFLMVVILGGADWVYTRLMDGILTIVAGS